MARPKSMPDFAALLDASTPLHGKEIPRKKPSISLAAGLIMASESPKSIPNTPQHFGQGKNGEWSDNLFYAYAQKSDYAQSPPYILTFASAAVCEQWWSLVQREYPESTRVGPQLFILKSDDMQEQIQDNPRFYDLRNKWFYTAADSASASTGVIPLQDYKGYPVTAPSAPTPQEEKKDEAFDMGKLSAALDRMNSMIVENSAQIRALSVAQSEGLQRMQEINESNSAQIKALGDNQTALQSLISENAAHYIALSGSSFAAQESAKSLLSSSTTHIEMLVDGQTQLAKTCEGMMQSIESLSHSVSKVNETMSQSCRDSDTASNPPSSVGSSFGGAMANRISPPPRKLNRRIKGVWYEYDDGGVAGKERKSNGGTRLLDTPPKSPLARKVV